MSREKLRQLGIELPLFPTTSVGSFPKPDYLMRARAAFARKKISRQELVEVERQATEFWIRKQEELGVDVLVDGRNTRLEDAGVVAKQLERIARGAGLDRAYLTPSCGLEYLPRDRAQLKLKLLATIQKTFLGSHR